MSIIMGWIIFIGDKKTPSDLLEKIKSRCRDKFPNDLVSIKKYGPNQHYAIILGIDIGEEYVENIGKKYEKIKQYEKIYGKSKIFSLDTINENEFEKKYNKDYSFRNKKNVTFSSDIPKDKYQKDEEGFVMLNFIK